MAGNVSPASDALAVTIDTPAAAADAGPPGGRRHGPVGPRRHHRQDDAPAGRDGRGRRHRGPARRAGPPRRPDVHHGHRRDGHPHGEPGRGGAPAERGSDRRGRQHRPAVGRAGRDRGHHRPVGPHRGHAGQQRLGGWSARTTSPTSTSPPSPAWRRPTRWSACTPAACWSARPPRRPRGTGDHLRAPGGRRAT